MNMSGIAHLETIRYNLGCYVDKGKS